MDLVLSKPELRMLPAGECFRFGSVSAGLSVEPDGSEGDPFIFAMAANTY